MHERMYVLRFVIPLYYSLILHSSLVLNYDRVMTLRIGKQLDLITDNLTNVSSNSSGTKSGNVKGKKPHD
jgi:hypothetical protein